MLQVGSLAVDGVRFVSERKKAISYFQLNALLPDQTVTSGSDCYFRFRLLLLGQTVTSGSDLLPVQSVTYGLRYYAKTLFFDISVEIWNFLNVVTLSTQLAQLVH